MSGSTNERPQTVVVLDNLDPIADSRAPLEIDPSQPLVSIGLAVYNGEEFLVQAIESVLAQTYLNLEVIISDNASTDASPEICAHYAALDPRIRYFRNDSNIGGARNENRTVDLAQGKYFRWAAHDDYVEPTLIERCVEVLELLPSVAICYSRTQQVDSNARTTTVISRNHGQSRSAWRRFARVIRGREFLEESYGVVRLDLLRSISLQGNYTASDRPLLAELSLAGEFHEIPEVLFTKRLHAKNRYLNWRTRSAWFRPGSAGLSFPWWSQLRDLTGRALSANAPIPTRMMCALCVGWWSLTHSPNLAKDLAVNARMAMMGQTKRRAVYDATRNWE